MGTGTHQGQAAQTRRLQLCGGFLRLKPDAIKYQNGLMRSGTPSREMNLPDGAAKRAAYRKGAHACC
jgi:hypothetical protein